jgi:predicted DNA-binding transcriptional regulator AlpA
MSVKIKAQSDANGEPDTLVPDAQVCRELGGISLMTLYRRTNYEVNFPAQVKINGRNFRFRSQVEAYKRQLLHDAMRKQRHEQNLRLRVPLPDDEAHSV